jgi:dihydrofolate reductase
MTAVYTWDVFSTLDGYGSFTEDADFGGYMSSTLTDTLGWPDATIVNGGAVEVVNRLKEESDVPLRSQASLSLNRALMAAGVVDRLQVTVFPVISGRTGTSPVFGGADDFDLELLECRTLDGHTPELVYRPSLH